MLFFLPGAVRGPSARAGAAARKPWAQALGSAGEGVNPGPPRLSVAPAAPCL
ncbi:hypothetical protein HMPREF0731_1092 [Pseudoroseomonas cervicalis ATCC 49957]|uniref:Uncharacterized protein n=1 Tax=Pseudoroseomonas cervicalis ATCC 49957 TaxID=525371 RepID=D5RJ32_9PROT|nr:hypothetical protein HMPREF0731_1092 [Pseudoroseomonas cervicalis ATCC 49957]